MPNVILVTGATGLLGNNVVRILVEQGVTTRVLLRPGHDKRCLADLNVEQVTGDIRSSDEIRTACQGVSTVIHCAGNVQIGWSTSRGHQEVNVDGARNIAACAHDLRLRLVHVSTVNCLAFGKHAQVADEDSPLTGQEVPCNYVLSKRAADREIRQRAKNGLDAIIVYPGFMLGPWDWKPSSGNMILQLARGGGWFAPRGGCSVCDVRDVAGGIIAAARMPSSGGPYILAGHNVSYLELWREIATVTHTRQPVSRFGPLAAAVAGRGGDLYGAMRGVEPLINSASVAMSSCYHYYSSDRARKELDYQVRGWQTSLVDAWQWFCQYGYGTH
jgi:dihydroflavonol-4-reductase